MSVCVSVCTGLCLVMLGGRTQVVPRQHNFVHFRALGIVGHKALAQFVAIVCDHVAAANGWGRSW